jgi:cytoskeletal protein CcmA (bactofilin family)
MALWRDNNASNLTAVPTPGNITPKAPETTPRTAPASAESAAAAPRAAARAEVRESLISAGLAIEGKISGTGNVRIAGQFKGDAVVDGNLSIEPGAKHQGEVRAGSVTVGGELTGNIAARHIDVTATGVVVGDVKADTITVASGSRMRGHVEFGWGDGASQRHEHKGNGASS